MCMYIYILYIYILYIYIYINVFEQCIRGKRQQIQQISQLVLAVGILMGHVFFMICKIVVTLFDVNKYNLRHNLTHMQREGTVVNGRSTAYRVLNLVLDLNQNLIKFLVFLYNSSLYLSVFVLEPLLIYS